VRAICFDQHDWPHDIAVGRIARLAYVGDRTLVISCLSLSWRFEGGGCWNIRVYRDGDIQPHLLQRRARWCELRHGSEIVVVVDAASVAGRRGPEWTRVAEAGLEPNALTGQGMRRAQGVMHVLSCGEVNPNDAGEGKGACEFEAVGDELGEVGVHVSIASANKVPSSHEYDTRPRQFLLSCYCHAALLVYYHLCSTYPKARPRCL
jgi:hypothetical protein